MRGEIKWQILHNEKHNGEMAINFPKWAITVRNDIEWTKDKTPTSSNISFTTFNVALGWNKIENIIDKS